MKSAPLPPRSPPSALPTCFLSHDDGYGFVGTAAIRGIIRGAATLSYFLSKTTLLQSSSTRPKEILNAVLSTLTAPLTCATVWQKSLSYNKARSCRRVGAFSAAVRRVKPRADDGDSHGQRKHAAWDYSAAAFGVNTAVWDGNLLDTSVPGLLSQAGITALRFPGGSTSDDYHWQTQTTTDGGYVNPATRLTLLWGWLTKALPHRSSQ